MVYLPALRSGSATIKQDSQICDQPTDGIHETVVAVERDQSRDTEERRGAHVVAGNGEAILPSGNPASGRKVGIGAVRSLCRPRRDDQRDRHKSKENGQRQRRAPARTFADIPSNLSAARTYNHASTHAITNCDNANKYAIFKAPDNFARHQFGKVAD